MRCSYVFLLAQLMSLLFFAELANWAHLSRGWLAYVSELVAQLDNLSILLTQLTLVDAVVMLNKPNGLANGQLRSVDLLNFFFLRKNVLTK